MGSQAAGLGVSEGQRQEHPKLILCSGPSRLYCPTPRIVPVRSHQVLAGGWGGGGYPPEELPPAVCSIPHPRPKMNWTWLNLEATGKTEWNSAPPASSPIVATISCRFSTSLFPPGQSSPWGVSGNSVARSFVLCRRNDKGKASEHMVTLLTGLGLPQGCH